MSESRSFCHSALNGCLIGPFLLVIDYSCAISPWFSLCSHCAVHFDVQLLSPLHNPLPTAPQQGQSLRHAQADKHTHVNTCTFLWTHWRHSQWLKLKKVTPRSKWCLPYSILLSCFIDPSFLIHQSLDTNPPPHLRLNAPSLSFVFVCISLFLAFLNLLPLLYTYFKLFLYHLKSVIESFENRIHLNDVFAHRSRIRQFHVILIPTNETPEQRLHL